MTIAGWIIMVSSVGGVTALFAWSLYRVLVNAPPADKQRRIEDIETPDMKED